MLLSGQSSRSCTIHCESPCFSLNLRNSRQPSRRPSCQQKKLPQSLHGRSFGHRHACQRNHRRKVQGNRNVVTCSLQDTLVGVGLFFTPSLLALVYATVKGKGNTKDGLSRMLTELSQGYFQPDVGGETIPVAQGELSDLAGDEPLFKALYQWWASVPRFHIQETLDFVLTD